MSTPRMFRLAALVLLVIGGYWATDRLPNSDTGNLGPTTRAEQGEAQILELFERQQSGQVVAVGGTVSRVLEDDLDGSRHQRFIMRLASGHTVLIAHNIDLAPRVPLERGDPVALRGEYEWNERGGVLHWTHHDPGGGRPGGWIEHAGQRYR